MILQAIKDVEESSLSINQHFKEKKAPFSQAQYYLYKKILKEKGIEGLSDQRSEGNNLRFTDDLKNFVIGLLEHNRSMSTTQVRNAIKNRFEITTRVMNCLSRFLFMMGRDIPSISRPSMVIPTLGRTHLV